MSKRTSLEDISGNIFGDGDDAKTRFWSWVETSDRVRPHIDELRQFVKFGEEDAHKDEVAIIALCNKDQKTGEFSKTVVNKSEWQEMHHLVRAITRIVAENTRENQPLEKILSYEKRCETVMHIIREIHYEHNSSKRGRYDDPTVEHNLLSTPATDNPTSKDTEQETCGTISKSLIVTPTDGSGLAYIAESEPRKVVWDLGVGIAGQAAVMDSLFPEKIQWMGRAAGHSLISLLGAARFLIGSLPRDLQNETQVIINGPKNAERREDVERSRQELDDHNGGITYSQALQDLGLRSPDKPYLQGSTPTTELHPFQIIGIAWMRRQALGKLRGGILADEMGLGKTIQVLALLEVLAREPSLLDYDAKVSLIVVPWNMLRKWEYDTKHWFPNLDVMVYTPGSLPLGKDDPFFQGGRNNLRKIILTTHNIMSRHTMNKRRSSELVREPTHTLTGLIGTLVIDEAHAFKNVKSKGNETLRMIHAERCFALTATLLDNSSKDIAGVLLLLDTNKMWSGILSNMRSSFNPYELNDADDRAILQGTYYAFCDWIVPKLKKNPHDIDAGLWIDKLLKHIYRRATYDTICNGPFGPRRVGELIPPMKKLTLKLGFQDEEKHRYIAAAKTEAKMLLTPKTTRNRNVNMLFHFDVLQNLHAINTWKDLLFCNNFETGDVQQMRKNSITLRGFLNKMVNETDFEWNGRWGGKPIDQCSDQELLLGVAKDSPIIRMISFLAAYIIWVAKRKFIIWLDFPIPQLFVELCISASGTRVEAFHAGLNSEQRQDLERKFNDSASPPFCLVMSTTLSAIDLELQLDCSDQVIAGTTFSDSEERQAISRIYRIGQKRVVTTYKLLLEDTLMGVRGWDILKKKLPRLAAHINRGNSASLMLELNALWQDIEGADSIFKCPEWLTEAVWDGIRQPRAE